MIPAFQLPDERRVARGECLLKATIPTNKMSLVKENEEETKEVTVLGRAGKNKRSDERKDGKEEGRRKSSSWSLRTRKSSPAS